MLQDSKTGPNKAASRLRRTTSSETNQLTAELLAWRGGRQRTPASSSLPSLCLVSNGEEKKLAGIQMRLYLRQAAAAATATSSPLAATIRKVTSPPQAFSLLAPLTCPRFSPQNSPSSLTHGRLGFSHAHTSLQTTPTPTPNHRGNRPGSPPLSCKNHSHSTRQVVKNVSGNAMRRA